MQLSDIKKIYFLGIGGIGMSAIARYFNHHGVKVYGYDLVNTSLTKKLEDEGMIIHYKEDISAIPKDIDLVVLTPAIPYEHEELKWFQKNNYTIKKRAEVLGLLSQEMNSIAIAGTHGKTTTSSLIGHILKYCGKDVTAFLGGILAEENSNYIQGDSDLVVLEADEYDRSFLHLHPTVLAIMSMDADHLDIYGTVEEMYKAYKQLTFQIKENGLLLLGPDVARKMSYEWMKGLAEKGIRVKRMFKDFDYENIRVEDSRYYFDSRGVSEIKNIKSNLPGLHNLKNTIVGIQICQELGLSNQEIKKAISEFKGIKRRFEIVFEGDRILVDDYAHHPEELKNAVETVKDLYPGKKVLGVFQPHLYSRTKDFYRDFADELSHIDGIIVLPIYPAREEPIEGIKSELIYNLIKSNHKYLEEAPGFINRIKELKDYEVIITIGASDLDKYHGEIIKILKKK